MVRDQRSIYVTKVPIFEIPQGSRSGTFLCILYLEEFIFFTFHTKSVLGRSFTYFPIVNTLSEQHLNYRNSEKNHVKKKDTQKWLEQLEKTLHSVLVNMKEQLSMFLVF